MIDHIFVLYSLLFCLMILAVSLWILLSKYRQQIRLLSEEIIRLKQAHMEQKKRKETLCLFREKMLPIPQSLTHVSSNEITKKLLNDTIFNKSDWETLEGFINRTQHCFVKRFRKEYTMLSEDDIRLTMLIRMDMNNTQIARFLHIQLTSLATKRYRMGKKMKLHEISSVSDFIKGLFNDVEVS